jgi:uncharacterized membrane protein SpoIIM required for sporulation
VSDIADAPAPGAAASSLTLRSNAFRRGREAGWRELERLVEKADRHGMGALDVEEVQRLPTLYAAAISSLSVARSIALERNMLLYLENLSLRAFLLVYGPRETLIACARDFFRRGFPQAVRASALPIMLALVAILAGVAAGYLLAKDDEAWFSALVPGDLAGGRGRASTRESLLETEIFAPWPGFAQSFVVFANFLFRHNTVVGLMTFGLGVVGGVPTLMLLVYQGLGFGAFLALHANRGLATDFLGWVAIHGVTEFGAIILCGAGGLVIAKGVLFPGPAARLDNVAAVGRTAARLAVGAVAMFFIAGLIEGGLRQLVASTPARFAFAAATLAVWLAYFLGAGRR